MLRPAHLLRSDKFATHITEHPVALAVVLCTAWILLGLIGHDPWKPDEAQNFGVVYQLLKGRDWVIPLLAGEPYVDKPPLIYHLTQKGDVKHRINAERMFGSYQTRLPPERLRLYERYENPVQAKR